VLSGDHVADAQLGQVHRRTHVQVDQPQFSGQVRLSERATHSHASVDRRRQRPAIGDHPGVEPLHTFRHGQIGLERLDPHPQHRQITRGVEDSRVLRS
jgi:hypothetical protein